MSEPFDLEEGECAELSDSSSSSELLPQPNAVLPVAKFNKEFTPESSPRCGEEYLCLVRHQAHHISSPNLPDIPNDNVGPTFEVVSVSSPIPVTQEQIDSAISHFSSNKVISATNINEKLKQALKGDLSNLLCLDPLALTPSQISDLRRIAKEIGMNNVEFVIIVAACFGQRDLIVIQ